jgi:hypothetical protein
MVVVIVSPTASNTPDLEVAEVAPPFTDHHFDLGMKCE